MSGKKTGHPGRYFYKCPLDETHDQCFLWCDKYHSQAQNGQVPKFVLNHRYNATQQDSCETSSTSIVLPADENRATRLKWGDLEVTIALFFMMSVVFILGMVFGKIV